MNLCVDDTSIANEEWQHIPKFNGYYSASTLGRIRSNHRVIIRNDNIKTTIKERILKQTSNGTGYLVVYLCLNATTTTYLVHRAVADSFLENPLNKKTINHINGIKTDNRLANIERATQSENLKHAYRTGLREPPMKGAFGILNGNSKRVSQYSIRCGILLNTFDCQHSAARHTGVDNSSISKSCRGVLKSAGGYIWKFN